MWKRGSVAFGLKLSKVILCCCGNGLLENALQAVHGTTCSSCRIHFSICHTGRTAALGCLGSLWGAFPITYYLCWNLCSIWIFKRFWKKFKGLVFIYKALIDQAMDICFYIRTPALPCFETRPWQMASKHLSLFKADLSNAVSCPPVIL